VLLGGNSLVIAQTATKIFATPQMCGIETVVYFVKKMGEGDVRDATELSFAQV